jgi:hypothetical protein
VFVTDAKVEPEFLVSDVGNGWAVTTTTLMHERRGADAPRSWAIPSDKPGRIYEEEREEIRTTMRPGCWIEAPRGWGDRLLTLVSSYVPALSPCSRLVRSRRAGDVA